MSRCRLEWMYETDLSQSYRQPGDKEGGLERTICFGEARRREE